MQSNKFMERIKNNGAILSDGAMGTLLHGKGIRFDECFDALNLSNPAVVAEIHRAYLDAGSNMIQTNTFGANRYKLKSSGLEDKVAEINTAGVDLVRRVAYASFMDVIIAGDVGPLGVRLAPFGRVQLDEARAAFKEQIAVLAAANVDVILIETMADLYEVREAILAAREIDPALPVIASMTFTRDDRTLLGDSPEKVAQVIHAAGAEVIGINCSGGPLQLLRLLKKMKKSVPQAAFSVMPNAGWPEQQDGRIMYPAGPEYFGDYATAFLQAGARVVGGCCGTTPQHIAAMAQVLKNADFSDTILSLDFPLEHEEKETQEQVPRSELAKKLDNGDFIIAVEMDPPRGVSTQKILAGASLLVDSGADVINVADSPMARMRMSPWAVCSLIQKHVQTETVLHFPTRGRNLLRVQGDLLAAHALGIRNVFVVMGDPTAIGDYPEANDNFDLVPSGLIRLIKDCFNIGLDHSGAEIGLPTSFFVGAALNLNALNPEHEARNLVRKIEAGADFFLTQPVFDIPHTRAAILRMKEHVDGARIPIFAGILPLVTDRHANFLHHEVPGISIPEEAMRRMQEAGEKGPRAGIQIAAEIIQGIRDLVDGIYLMPAFSRFDYASEIVEEIRRN